MTTPVTDPPLPASGEGTGPRLADVLARMGVREHAYRSMVEQLPVVVYLEAIEGLSRTLFIASGIEGLVGIPPREWVRQVDGWFDHVHPDDRDRVLRASLSCDRTLEPFRQEYRMRRSDGTYVWLLEESQMLRDDAGGPVCWQGYLQDITARKESERRRREAEARLRSLIETIPAITYTHHHLSLTFEYVSPQVEAILGYLPERWSGELWREILHPDDREAVIAENDRVDGTGERFSMEYRVRAADGRWVWLRDESVLLNDADGRPTVWQGIMIDVSDVREAEQRLRLAESRYRSVVEHNPAVLYVQDLDPDHLGTVFVSPQIEALTGYSVERWMEGDEIREEAVHPDDLPRMIEAERRSIETGEPYSVDIRIVRPDGSIVWVHDSATLAFDPDGRPAYWQGFLHDITEKKRAEEELSRALELERRSTESLRALDEMKDVFLTAVSHELRSPLAAIVGSARTLEMFWRDLDAEDREGLVDVIMRKAARLQEIVEDLLDLERLRRGASPLERTDVDLADLARESLSASGLSDTHRVRASLPGCHVSVDRAMTARILDNLLSNAARYTPDGSTVWLTVRPIGRGAEIVVEDDGPGVPPDQRGFLFEPFRQGTATVAHSPGVGVGLALVARFAELHGGRAWVTERDGGGASFHVMLEGDGS
jgi:PAS domain S-box-containing protein